MRKEMGRWTLRLSLGLGLLAALLTSFCSADGNYCLLSKDSNCSSCIRSGVGCAYCSDETFKAARCDLTENIRAHGCSAAGIITATSSRKIELAQRIEKSRAEAQVYPQRMTMSFLPGEAKELDMEVFAPEKGPLDLYILMDFSNSMSDDLKSLKRMGKTLAELVQSLSDDYTIGFGKFVDKVVEPQTDMRPEKLAKPWPDSDPPFSFRNVIPLTGDADSFNSKLQGERISGNLDAPEGGFDAMLQATVCSNQIGWRNHSTHLLVFSTESAFHYENDGANVLSGILPRNDEQCHLDASGKYTQDTTQDYPSVPTLVRLMGEHNIIPIFAVTQHSYDYYEKLQDYFPIAELGLLDEDSSNILSILKLAFISIRSKMSLRAEQLPQAFKAEFLKSGAVAESGAFKVKPGQIEKFKVRLQAQKKVGEQHVCQLKPDDKAGVTRVKPSTFSQALDIKTELLCPTCSCENTPSPGAARCSTHGDLVCGKCRCDDGWLGAYCNCSASASSLGAAQCTAPEDQLPCSGNGDCLCGTCVCYNPDQHDGTYCQYDKSHCARYGGFLCNDRGSCSLGQCACAPGWGGAACECPKGNSTCVDRKGGICNGRGECVCGLCECQGSGVSLTSTCEANLEAQVAFCEAKRACVQCQAWKTGENKDNCEGCSFKVTMVDELKEKDKVIDTCDFRDETDDCTYYYTVDYPEDKANKELEVQVLKKKECPPGGFLWLIPLIMFLMLLLGLLMLCCWKYCRCCWGACLALLPCCGAGRKVGFTEDEYLLRQSQLTSDHLDTPMVRTGPPKGTDVVRWKVQDNVHRGAHHPEAQVQPSPKETIQFPVSLRLNKKYSDNMSQPDSIDTELLRKDVNDNLNEVYKQIPGAQKVQKTAFRYQRNAGRRQDRAIVDTVLSAPRSSYPDIVKLTEKNVQSGRFNELRVLPGYYTVATDREASGAVEFQEEVQTVDVRVPLFTKEEDDDKKQLKVEAVDVPLGVAAIKKRFVHITILKEHAKSVFTFLQPAYSYSRQEGVAKIPIRRNISEDGRTQVTYRTRDLTARDKHDYLSLEGDLSYAPGETEKVVPVQLLELGELSNLLDEKQVKQFVLELSNPRQGAKLGAYPTTTVTILDEPDPSVIMFKKVNQAFSATEPSYNIPVVRTRNLDAPATAKWRTKNKLFDQSGTLKFGPGQTEKNIRIEKGSLPPGPAGREPFTLELLDPSPNAVVGERKTTMVHIGDGAPRSPDVVTMGSLNQKCSSPGGRLGAPPNAKAKSTGPKKIQLSWDPPPGNPVGYKVKYWIYGDPETKAEVVDVTTPQAELGGLYPSCDYEMRVSAYNAMGEGFNTEVIPCKTLEDLPSEPGRLAFNVISPTVTQVSWAEPAETNGDITAYDVVYTPIADDRKPVGPAKTVKIDSPRKRMLLIENLQRAQTYMYKVRAKNSVGWGPYRDATINLASQPVRPLSIPIIPDIPIVDAEAGDEYDGYLMYSSEVLRSPSGSKTPSVSGEGWKHVKLVGSSLDLRRVSWRKVVVEEIPPPASLSSDAESSADEAAAPPASRPQPGDQLINGKYEQGFLFPGSASRNMSSSSSPMSTLSYRAAGGSMNTTLDSTTTTTYLSGQDKTSTTYLSGQDKTSTTYLSGQDQTSTTYLSGQDKTSTTYLSGQDQTSTTYLSGQDMTSTTYLSGQDKTSTTYLSGQDKTSTTYLSGQGKTSTTYLSGQDQTSTTYLSGQGNTFQQDFMIGGIGGIGGLGGGQGGAGGGSSTRQVVMRKHSEHRGYADENVRDSIIIGDIGGRFPDLGGFGLAGTESSFQSQYGGSSSSSSTYGFSQTASASRARTESSDVYDALHNLDRVLQADSRGNPGVPDTPTRLVFSALGPTALRVSWQEPHCDRDILGYSVIYQQLNGGEVKRINVSSPGDNSVVVQDLLPNHSYLFKVKAQSQEGWGPEREGVITIESAVDPQSPLSPMPGSPFTLSTPSAPGPLVFTALSPEALQLSWDQPRKPNGDILGYVVTCEQLHGGGDLRSFQVSGDSAETSLTVPNLSENMPYKFKVQARTTQGFGPEREGIITIESQDGGTMSQYSGGSSMTRREVFQMPTEVSSHTNVSRTMFTEPYFGEDSGGGGGGSMMMTTQHMETSGVMTTGMVTRQVTQGMVQKSMVGGTTVTKKVERFYES